MPPVALVGFLRLYVAGAELPPQEPALVLQNPHVARSVLSVDGTKLGEVAPLARVTVSGLPEGVHTIAWTTPSGFTRTVTTGPSPAR